MRVKIKILEFTFIDLMDTKSICYCLMGIMGHLCHQDQMHFLVCFNSL